MPIFQSWFGHRAEKATVLYIVGLEPRDVPPYRLILGDASHVIARNGGRGGTGKNGRRIKGDAGWRPEVTKAEREHTPRALAEWLVELARRCRV